MGRTFKDVFQIPEDATYEEKYRAIVNGLGYEDVRRCIPFSLEEIQNALAQDPYLNNLPLQEWDWASGFAKRRADVVPVGSPLVNLYHKAGVTAFSNSEGVCILKECARMWVEKERDNDMVVESSEMEEPDNCE